MNTEKKVVGKLAEVWPYVGTAEPLPNYGGHMDGYCLEINNYTLSVDTQVGMRI